jgi:hypothetical protein
MNLTLDLPQSLKQSVGSAALSRLKSLLSTNADDRTGLAPAARPYSFQAECECLDDCLRDHENE